MAVELQRKVPIFAGNDMVLPSANGDGQRARIGGIDFVKGALVLIMILYHWINYFIGIQWEGYRYLRFLTPSFIFVTGFLIGHLYLQRSSYGDRRLRTRLLWRGLKLLGLFVVLNLVTEYTVGGRLHLRGAPSSWLLAKADEVFVHGSMTAAFDILVSIAYFLILAPAILSLSGLLRISLWPIATVVLVATALANYTGRSNSILEMLSIALLGLATGACIPLPRRSRWILIVLPVVYLAHLVALGVWDSTFSLQVVAVCLNLLLLYAVALYIGTDRPLQRLVVRLGEYSLMSYILQIITLQLLVRVLRTTSLEGISKTIPLVVTVAVVIGVVEVCAFARDRWSIVNRAYRIVFA
jgi:peptidoglycan/LPS O-acetylase OafA/YrhL